MVLLFIGASATLKRRSTSFLNLTAPQLNTPITLKFGFDGSMSSFFIMGFF